LIATFLSFARRFSLGTRIGFRALAGRFALAARLGRRATVGTTALVLSNAGIAEADEEHALVLRLALAGGEFFAEHGEFILLVNQVQFVFQAAFAVAWTITGSAEAEVHLALAIRTLRTGIALAVV
jgi:hypothetical protein